MSVLVVVSPGEIGREAVRAGVEQAEFRNSRLVLAKTHDEKVVVPGHIESHEVALGTDQDQAYAVLDLQIQHRAELIVMGIKRRSPVGKFLLGSTAQRILVDSEVPVHVIKAGR